MIATIFSFDNLKFTEIIVLGMLLKKNDAKKSKIFDNSVDSSQMQYQSTIVVIIFVKISV